jgi:hypothetical protein
VAREVPRVAAAIVAVVETADQLALSAIPETKERLASLVLMVMCAAFEAEGRIAIETNVGTGVSVAALCYRAQDKQRFNDKS